MGSNEVSKYGVEEARENVEPLDDAIKDILICWDDECRHHHVCCLERSDR